MTNNPDSRSLKIVIGTDVRFWHCQTGAQRRIHSMVRYLIDAGCDVTTLFVSSLADPLNGRSASDEIESIRQANLNVVSLLEHWYPEGTLARVIWRFKCIANWLKTGFGRWSVNRPSQPEQPAVGGRFLSDIQSPLYQERFQNMVQRLDPDAVIIEYVTLGYLVPADRVDSRPRYLVDTHDLLCERFRQFKKFGFDHWIRISREEEAEMLRRFDTIIAIQTDEQAEFREMIKRSRDVILAGHPADTCHPVTGDETLNAPHTLGYFGSDNASNVQAIKWFLERVWPELVAARPKTTLLVAGTVCRSLKEAVRQTPGVAFQENVDDVAQLYRSFQIAINPVQFGTGLKIKNQESLAHGKPLVVTRQGFTGMLPATAPSPIFVVDDEAAMKDIILQLAGDEDQIRVSVEAACRYAEQNLSPHAVYRQLMVCLRGQPITDDNCPERKIKAGV